MSGGQKAYSLLLLNQKRFREAEESLRQVLAQDPQDALAHALLSSALSGQDKYVEALSEAQQAIRLAPNVAHSHYTLALALIGAKRLDEAVRATQEALRLDPVDPEYYYLLSLIHLQKADLLRALDAAEQGLRHDPQHEGCNNTRAMVLIRLGREKEAGKTLASTLARNPENAMTHANQGMALLQAAQPEQAMQHFREALRLDPNLKWARRGIIVAMKARNPIYMIILNYIFWMSRLKPAQQWMVVVGLFFLGQFTLRTARSNPELAPVLYPFLALYMIFAMMTWIADDLFNLVLRLDRFGRQVLFREQIVATNGLAVCLLVAPLLAGAGLLSSGDQREALLIAAAQSLAMLMPVAGVFKAKTSEDRGILILYAAGLVVLILVDLLLALSGQQGRQALGMFVLGWVGYTWIGNYLIGRRQSPD
ncbi:MAG: tetratricopeptide repeat protein [Chloroflexi bacterium]|nr:tetratricopeptide repeat protein [Chloroflexota bacterium]